MTRSRLAPTLLFASLGASCATGPEPVALDAHLRAAPGEAWTVEEPSSSMRVAQYALDGPGGGASLVVYHFEGGGGGVDANFERWLEQLEDERGETPAADLVRDEVRGDLVVHELRAHGRYVAPVTPGSDETYDEPDWELRAAVVETPRGPYYLKLVGPRATVRVHGAAWERFVDSLALARE